MAIERDSNGALIATTLPGLPPPQTISGWDVYALSDDVELRIATDRVSVRGRILPYGIPEKGRVSAALTRHWCKQLRDVPHHFLLDSPPEWPAEATALEGELAPRSLFARATTAVPVECIARGYLSGSAWQDYQKRGLICGIGLRAGYPLASQLDDPLFTPALKTAPGDVDENISYARLIGLCGAEDAAAMRRYTLELYSQATSAFVDSGLIVADGKFEFGLSGTTVGLNDEFLTPDSSRIWLIDGYKPGRQPRGLDKQPLRDYLQSQWTEGAQPPELSGALIDELQRNYAEVLRRITGVTL